MSAHLRSPEYAWFRIPDSLRERIDLNHRALAFLRSLDLRLSQLPLREQHVVFRLGPHPMLWGE